MSLEMTERQGEQEQMHSIEMKTEDEEREHDLKIRMG